MVADARPLVPLLAAALLTGCFSAPRYQGPPSDHFDGARFVNREPVREPRFTELMRMFMSEDQGRWDAWTDNRGYPPPPERVGAGALRVTFVNHATTLVQMDGLNILTDPIWAERCSPVSFAGPARVRPPGVALEDLPPIDAVIISHNHYDHLDLETLAALAAANPGLRIFVGLGVDALLEREGIPGAVALDWYERVALSDEVTLVGWPNRHFSGRGLDDRDATLWLSYVLLGPGGPVYFAGDTGWGAHFAEAGRAHGPLRLAILPIGAYLPRWFMAPIHISPEEAVDAARDLRASTSVGIHFGTFPLAKDGQYRPMQDLAAALARRRPRPRFWVLDFGEGRAVPALPDSRRAAASEDPFASRPGVAESDAPHGGTRLSQ